MDSPFSSDESRPWERFDAPAPESALISPPLAPATRFSQLQALRLRHHRMIQLAVAGLSNVEIAAALRMTPETVGKTLKTPLAQERIAELTGMADAAATDLKTQIDELGPLAISVLEDTMLNSVDERTRLSAASKTLEYLLQKAGSKLEVNHAILTGADILALRQRVAQVKALPPAEQEEFFTVQDVEALDLDLAELDELDNLEE